MNHNVDSTVSLLPPLSSDSEQLGDLSQKFGLKRINQPYGWSSLITLLLTWKVPRWKLIGIIYEYWRLLWQKFCPKLLSAVMLSPVYRYSLPFSNSDGRRASSPVKFTECFEEFRSWNSLEFFWFWIWKPEKLSSWVSGLLILESRSFRNFGFVRINLDRLTAVRRFTRLESAERN